MYSAVLGEKRALCGGRGGSTFDVQMAGQAQCFVQLDVQISWRSICCILVFVCARSYYMWPHH